MVGRPAADRDLLVDLPGRYSAPDRLRRDRFELHDSRHTAKLALALGTIYLVWGSSFLFTKIAVADLPPALFSGIRFVTAGTLLALIARIWNRSSFPARRIEWRHVMVAGFFMVFVSNGLNTWSMQYLPTNQAALLNGTSAFWIAGLGVFGRRGHPLTRWAVLGLAIGFTGAALMLVPKEPLTTHGLLAQAGVLTACFSWSLGTLYYRSIDSELDSLMFMALQMFAGGLMLLIVGIAHGDAARWAPGPSALIAFLYLTFCSSCLAYTAYGWLSLNATPALIGTYGYVNPAIAAFLGWQFLHERLSPAQLAGMVVIIVGVGILTLPGGSLTDPKTLAEPKTQ
jgi:drug/metabolite transporter (DMT)-like permease